MTINPILTDEHVDACLAHGKIEPEILLSHHIRNEIMTLNNLCESVPLTVKEN